MKSCDEMQNIMVGLLMMQNSYTSSMHTTI